ncbi:MAG: hypothetical protein HYY93_00825 [Planctomycetes bacterium]|nr:hypothetical protein [Planctomycetota bacterium]
MEVPRMAPGKVYTLVFRADYSVGKEIMTRMIPGAEASFPVPEFGTRCVCCDAETSSRSPQQTALSNTEWQNDPIDVPMCSSCDAHVGKRGLNLGACFALVVFGVLGVVGAFSARGLRPWGWLIGGPLLLWGCGWLLQMEMKRRRLASQRHYIDLLLSVAPGQCSVRTSSGELARRLASLNPAILHAVH